MHTLITIIILLVMLGILISSHEAGHLFVAKRFNIYCDEYSIGFGPKLFSYKGKNSETRFSIRVIPLGGYVSMYGEGADEENKDEDDRFANIPKERSLEGVAPWKKALVLVAGITVNLVLSFVFCLIYSLSFPAYETYQSFVATDISTSSTSIASEKITFNNGTLTIGSHEGHPWVYGFYVEGSEAFPLTSNDRFISSGLAISTDQSKYGFIVDSDATLTNGKTGKEYNVVALFYPASESSATSISSCLTYYLRGESTSDSKYSLAKEMDVSYFPDFSSGAIKIANDDEISVSMKFSFVSLENSGHIVSSRTSKSLTLTHDSNGWSDSFKTKSNEYWAPFGTRLLNGCKNWCNFFIMIGQGLGSLFTFNFNNIGGVVAMGSSLSQLSNYMGWGKTFFYYGGLISLNLAIFNLLPFPGLDGWGLAVTLVEAISRKKVPQKAKGIMSMVGFILLIGLAVFITIKDVIRII